MLTNQDRGAAETAGPLPTRLAGGGEPGEKKDAPKQDEKTPPSPDPDPIDEDELDEELEESFPASDPPASTQP